ncbi:hypothetical protein EVAR_95322_1 [Eumeta japonica]|uniref:Uncharacterized protein n=1 Tax=Eumeta variegata TaxID=151549 RepID=A0A4C1U969_EUMVA|nr:hypothetical protein EVAR_95322_1 [Eumeta japonica]
MARGPPPTALALLLLAAAARVACYRDQYDGDVGSYCEDLSPYQGDLDLDLIKGGWFGVERILHTKGEYKIEYDSGECFYIDIREIDIVVWP